MNVKYKCERSEQDSPSEARALAYLATWIEWRCMVYCTPDISWSAVESLVEYYSHFTADLVFQKYIQINQAGKIIESRTIQDEI